MNLKKIRIIIGSLNVGGTEKQLLQIVNILSKKNWDIEIITIEGKGKLDRFLDKRIKIKHLASKNYPKVILLLQHIYKLYKIFKKDPRKTTHFILPQSYIMGMLALILSRAKCKSIMSRRSLNLYQKNYFFCRTIEKLLHKKVDKILVNSLAIRKQLINDENVKVKKIKLIYNGINIKKIKKYKKTNQNFTAVIVANIIPYKCHDILFKALSLIKEDLPKNWKLICLGRDDGLKQKLLNLSKKLKIYKNITFKETMDVENFLQKSDIGILCSNEEGFPNAILEYYASKLPVIATNVGGCRELIENKRNGLLIPKNDPKKLSEAIIFLYKNKGIAKKYGETGFKAIKKKFDIKKTVNEYEKIYTNI